MNNAARFSVHRIPAETPFSYADRPLPIGFVPRKGRDMVRAKRAGEGCQGSAMDQALAMIGAGFDESRIHNATKVAVESALADGEWSIPVRVRYSKLAFNFADNDLGKAMRQIEALYRCKGRPRQHVLPVVKEARLFLRWFRRHGDARMFPAIIEALTTGPEHQRPPSVAAA